LLENNTDPLLHFGSLGLRLLVVDALCGVDESIAVSFVEVVIMSRQAFRSFGDSQADNSISCIGFAQASRLSWHSTNYLWIELGVWQITHF